MKATNLDVKCYAGRENRNLLLHNCAAIDLTFLYNAE